MKKIWLDSTLIKTGAMAMNDAVVVNDEDRLQLIAEFKQEAPVRVGLLAQRLGLGVLRSTLQPGISGQIEPSRDFPAGFVIKVNRHEAKQRQRFTIAHEIGHFMLHRDRIGDGIRDTILYRSKLSNQMEAEANRFAAGLLMPFEQVRTKLNELGLQRDHNAAIELARVFEVSTDAMEIRLGLR
jgi:hypothetical protein